MVGNVNTVASVSAVSRFETNGSFSINGVKVTVFKGNSLKAIVHRINSVSSRTGVIAKINEAGKITLSSKNNKPIKIQDRQGVLFCTKGKTDKVGNISKLTDVIHNKDMPDNVVKVDGNVTYIKNAKPIKDSDSLYENILQKIGNYSNRNLEERVKLSKYWLSICVGIQHYYTNNIDTHVQHYKDYLDELYNEVNNPYICNINVDSIDTVKNILHLYSKCYSTDNLKSLSSNILV